MKKRHNVKHGKKIRNLVAICALCAIVLSVSTYAWFIGFKRVNVNGFDIDIATTEGLYLSMDGETWTYQLDPDTADQYVGNTNTFAPNGLKPMSSVGDMDADVSRMILYEKGSLTTVAGGYRLLATRVDNYTKTEGNISQGDGYVAFDLFIKNLSGEEYYEENNIRNEEAIYLTTNSAVTVAATGGVPNTGIENSVRVAFAQIGRVEATTGATNDSDEIATITGITCANVLNEATVEDPDDLLVTGICRDAQIWEPNDKDHVQNALNYYNTSCRPRLVAGTDVEAKESYQLVEPGNTCTELNLDTAYPTYAISRRIDIDDQVNVYDGAEYNGYVANTGTYEDYLAADDKDTFKLVNFPYFTDTMKDIPGSERPEFMRLAPNSITKVRVYIWIEGQDIDNYDFAQLGLKISVNFGFTKERLEEGDIDYTGPSTDITPTLSQ